MTIRVICAAVITVLGCIQPMALLAQPASVATQHQAAVQKRPISSEMARQVQRASPSTQNVVITAAPPTTTEEESPPTEAAAPAATEVSLSALREQMPGGVRSAAMFQNGQISRVSNAVDSVVLEKGAVLSVRNANAQPVEVKSNGAIQEAASATVLYALDDQNVARTLALVHRTQGLSWNQAKQLFTGSLLVGIVDRNHPADTAGLPAPIPVQLQGAGDALNPNELAIQQVGGSFEKVNIAIADPEDPYRVTLVSTVDPDLPEASLPLRRLAVVLMAPKEMDAFGVGAGEVTVRAKDGRLRAGEPVTLYLDNGQLDKSTIMVGDDGVATTRMRSTSFGTGTLSLMAGPYVAAPVKIQYRPPYYLLMATAIGAAMGASIFVYALRGGGGHSRRFVLDWLIGFIVGVGVTAMAYAGMKLPGWIPMPSSLGGLVVPLAIAFVCAAMGAAIIHFLTGFSPRSNAAPARGG